MKQKKRTDNRFFDIVETPLGKLYLVFENDVLTNVDFERPVGLHLNKTSDSQSVRKEFAEYFERSRRDFTCKTAFAGGTEFEKKIWEALKEVPYGETQTYKWLAEKVGSPSAFRAVGQALGKNPLPIIFPCHRIIESDGSLGGYSGGIEIKRRLLEIEYYTKLSKS